MKPGSDKPVHLKSSPSLGYEDWITVAQFCELPVSRTDLGKIFLALLEEKSWSSDFFVYVDFTNYKHLHIRHPNFPSGYHVNIPDTVTMETTDGVRKKIITEINFLETETRQKIKELVEQQKRLCLLQVTILTSKNK